MSSSSYPTTIQSGFHPRHPLTLVNRQVNHHRPCDLCGGRVHGLSYSCRTCGCFDAHPLCTQRRPPPPPPAAPRRQPQKPKPRNLPQPPPPMRKVNNYRQPAPSMRKVNNYRQPAPPMRTVSNSRQPAPQVVVNNYYQPQMVMVNSCQQPHMMGNSQYQPQAAMNKRSSGGKTEIVGSVLGRLAVAALTTAVIGVPVTF